MMKLVLLILCLCPTGFYSKENRNALQIWPKEFKDERQPFAEFHCRAYLKPGEWLTWYLYKRGSTADKCLKTFQQQLYSDYKTLTLQLPLSNDESEIYCTKQEIATLGHYTTLSRSDNVIIKSLPNMAGIKKENPPCVTPDTFVDRTMVGVFTIEFTCWAYLKADDVLFWYQDKVSWWVVCGSAAAAVSALVLVAYLVKKYKQRGRIHEQDITAKDTEIKEDFSNMPSCPPSPGHEYEEVYAHGAGFKRPRRR